MKHGHSRRDWKSPTYRAWWRMCARVRSNEPSKRKYYKDRGITVCDRWAVFENFLADMGAKPDGTTLDRIDGNGNYEPGNCRWATHQEQARNRSSNHLIPFKGQQLTLTEVAAQLGMKKSTLSQRLRAGWSVEKAITTEVRPWP